MSGALPSAMFTMVMISSMVTVESPEQSPTHSPGRGGVGVGVKVADGVTSSTHAQPPSACTRQLPLFPPASQNRPSQTSQLPEVGVGSGVAIEHGSAQHGKYGGMQTHVPQQQLHSFPTGQLSGVDGLHSLTIGIGVGVGVWVNFRLGIGVGDTQMQTPNPQ